MTQPRNLNRLSFSLPSQRVLLLHGLSWVGALNVLGGDIGLAQTAISPGVVPSAEQLLSTPSAVPEPVAAPVAAPVPTQPQATQPEWTPSDQVPVTPTATEPASAEPLSQTPAPLPSATVPNNPYIDTTDYSIGATRDRDQPSSVVLSERSSGCRITLRQGQSVPNSVCAESAPIATRPSRPTSNYSTVPTSVSVGSVRVGVGGFSIGSTTPSGRDYYNRTIRPFGRLGNGNISPMFPLSIPAAITSVFGWRIHPITGEQRFHSGTDLGAALGTPVLAAYAGQVAVADFMQGYGLTVVLQHNSQQRAANQQAIVNQQVREETLYAHMSELFVQPGEWVQQGQVIGRVGSTGNSTGPHLHFEFRELTPQGWQALDPGQMLEYSLAQLMRSIQTAQANPEAFPKQSGFSRAIVAREAVAEHQGK